MKALITITTGKTAKARGSAARPGAGTTSGAHA
jgi:hypothetical protein